MDQETGFEKTRGVSRVEVRSGFAQVHVRGIRSPIMNQRLGVLRAIADAGVCIDFLKMTPDGFGCLIAEDQSAQVERALAGAGVEFAVATGRSVVLVHAVNMRSEEGLTATVIKKSIESGVKIEHISDMHDRMLLVVLSEEAKGLGEVLSSVLIDEQARGRR